MLPKILLYSSYFSVLIPIILLLARKQNFKSKTLKAVGLLLFAWAFTDLGGFILMKMGYSNLTLYNIAVIVQFFLLSYLYHILLNNKKIIYTGLVAFIVFFIVNISCIQPFREFQSWLFFASSIIFIMYAVLYYRQTLQLDTPIDPFYFHPFWVNSAVFCYFAFNLYLFAMSNYVFKNMSPQESTAFWGFHNFNNILKNLFLTIAVIVFKNKNKSPLLY